MKVLVVLALLSVALAAKQPGDPPTCVCMEAVESMNGVRNPTVLVNPHDGTNRMFIGEQLGLVWIVDDEWNRLPTPFLNMTDFVYLPPGGFDERGFLAMRFHPQYSDNGLFYIYYSALRNSDSQQITRFSEMSVMSDNPDRADLDSERILMELDQPRFNHNGGEIIFLDDNTTLLFTGDGGGSGDPDDNAQDKMSLLGKTLRIDVHTRTGELEYGIPPDNPYIDDPDARDELYAIGLRNPWRVTFDVGDRDTGEGRGRVLVADVGQHAWEEVNLMEAGGNYAWPAREGPACYRTELCGNIGPEVWPIKYYNHTHGGQCVIGGHIYRGCEFPDWQGWYFYGDYMNGRQWVMKDDDEGDWIHHDLEGCPESVCEEQGLRNWWDNDILSYGLDEQGEIYMLTTALSLPPTNPAGSILKMIDPYNRDESCPSSHRRK